MATTEINEPKWGRMFHATNNAEKYKINDDKLTIFYNSNNNGIVLKSI